MPHMKVVLNGEEVEDLKDAKKLIHLTNPITVTGLEKGMQSGKASAAFIFEIDRKEYVFAETSLALLVAAVDALKARYKGQY